jgi:hypothetical protein
MEDGHGTIKLPVKEEERFSTGLRIADIQSDSLEN